MSSARKGLFAFPLPLPLLLFLALTLPGALLLFFALTFALAFTFILICHGILFICVPIYGQDLKIHKAA